jgi:predicted ATP-dependent endonuclease of OLD family
VRYRAFAIRNFKGVSETRLELSQGSSPIPVTLIGLNESGKTTLLEAIYSFKPDVSSKILFSKDHSLVPDAHQRIPINRLSNFTANVEVTAEIEIEQDDVEALDRFFKDKKWKVDLGQFPRSIEVTSRTPYENSTPSETQRQWDYDFSVSEGRKKPKISTVEQWKEVTKLLDDRLPIIAYFPTSVFDFPSKIFLSRTPNDGLNNFYRNIFQDVLDVQGEDMKIKTHILERIKSSSDSSVFSEMMTAFFGSSERSKVQQVFDKASYTVSAMIVTRWNSLFKHSNLNREVVIEWGVEPGDSAEPKVFAEFKVKDGPERYNISSRSLGFRWFFCFLMFTQFRGKRKGSSGTLFLFDEPASNLHAGAQEELLESFSNVAVSPNELMYSTHSHHLINPIWLEQAFIIVNESIDYEEDVTGEKSDLAANVKAIPYRQFVNSYPDRTSYFQPVLDRLEVRPSAMDLNQDCVLVEGKSDYAVLRYFRQETGTAITIIPAFGATTLGSLIALMRGWGRRFFVVLDGDREGVTARERYKEDYSLTDEEIGLLSELTSAKEIENLLSKTDMEALAALRGVAKISKKNIYTMFQEAAAAGAHLPLSAEAVQRGADLLSSLHEKLTGTA